MQPYLLEKYNDPSAYSIAGLAAAIIAAAQILGGLSVKFIGKIFKTRSGAILVGISLSAITLALVSQASNFYTLLLLLVFWAIIIACMIPFRMAFLNALITSKERASILSFDSMISSGGGFSWQPILGKSADVYSYGFSYLICSLIPNSTLPLILLSKKQGAPEDQIKP